MKIAILCHASVGGSGIVATELALALYELGHTVHLIGEQVPFRLKQSDSTGQVVAPIQFYQELVDAPSTQSRWGRVIELGRKTVTNYFKRADPTKILQGSIHFHEIRPVAYPLFEETSLITLRAANAIAAVVDKYKIEIVHAHYAIPYSTSAILARDAGLPFKLVTTLHGTDVTKVGCDEAFKYTTRHAITHSDAVTAVSSSLIDSAKDIFRINREMEKIPNWVDTVRFNASTEASARAKYAQPEEPILVHLSNFRPIKRSTDVVKIFADVVAKKPARLILVGDGPDKAECIALAQELGVNGRLLSVPSTPQVEHFLSIADFLLLPSEQESFGLVALEAMAAGCVVIASEVGGLPELIEHKKTGFLSPMGDTQGMAQYILDVLDRPEELANIKVAARAKVIESYSPRPIVEQYLKVYERLLDSRN